MPELAKLAEEVFTLHPFDADLGLWRRVEIDGRVLGFDFTFNHQLWFAAAGALLAPHVGPEVTRRVERFLERLPANLCLYRDGLIHHTLVPAGLLVREPRYAYRQLRDRLQHAAVQRARAEGYHAFNCYGLALLATRHPEHACFRSHTFERLWRYARAFGFLASLESSPYGWAYNPSGFEIAYAIGVFESRRSGTQAHWVEQQLRHHFDFERFALDRDTADPATLAARLYEATRLPNLTLRLSQQA